MSTFSMSFSFVLTILQLSIAKTACGGHYYIQDTPLDMKQKLKLGCIRLEPSAKDDMIKCALLCTEVSSCAGISFDSSSHCFLHQQCTDLSPQGHITKSGHRYMVKSETPFPCLNGGVWREEKDRCDCKYGLIGKYCDAMAKICADLQYSGYTNGIHSVYLDLRNDVTSPVWIRCRIDPTSGYSYAMVTYNTGEDDYNKTYTEFVNGFGKDDGTMDIHFVDLEAIYLLNQAGYDQFHINLEIDTDAKYYGRYEVSVSNSTNGYALEVNGDWSYSKGDTHGFTLKNCFHELQNIPFSTWDSDNDDDPDNNCAARAGTGWWFRGFNVTCNLLGKWFGSETNNMLK